MDYHQRQHRIEPSLPVVRRTFLKPSTYPKWQYRQRHFQETAWRYWTVESLEPILGYKPLGKPHVQFCWGCMVVFNQCQICRAPSTRVSMRRFSWLVTSQTPAREFPACFMRLIEKLKLSELVITLWFLDNIEPRGKILSFTFLAWMRSIPKTPCHTYLELKTLRFGLWRQFLILELWVNFRDILSRSLKLFILSKDFLCFCFFQMQYLVTFNYKTFYDLIYLVGKLWYSLFVLYLFILLQR